MSIMELDFSEIMQIVLNMSFVGSVIAVILFMIKPIIKDRLPKSFQYYMWFIVFMALILPLSKIFMLPDFSASNNPTYDIVQWFYYTVLEEPVHFISLPQGEIGQNTQQTQNQFLNVATIFFFVWQFGMFVFLGFNIICYILFVEKLKKYNMYASTHEIELLNKLSGKGYTPKLYRNNIVYTPMLMGVFRPIIVLPDKKYEDMQLKNILLHELTHLRRYDVAVKWLSVFLGALHWYNPIIYFVRCEINRACELSCDEAVIKNLDMDGKRSYGDTLITVVAGKTMKVPLSTTMCEEKKVLKERLDAIMKYTDFSRKTFILSGVLLVIILFGTCYFSAASSADNTKNGNSVIYAADLTSFEKHKIDKEIELKKVLHNYDKKNIVETWVFLGDSDNEITYASIFIVSHEEITDSVKKDELVSLASKCLNLEKNDIYMDYMDVETFTSLGKVK